jgi:hypothetical protein
VAHSAERILNTINSANSKQNSNICNVVNEKESTGGPFIKKPEEENSRLCPFKSVQFNVKLSQQHVFQILLSSRAKQLQVHYLTIFEKFLEINKQKT